MKYYHATFFTNRDNILKWGLRKREERRIWRASDKRYNYLTGTEENAIGWMVDWYGYQIYELVYGNLRKVKQPWKIWNMVKQEELLTAWYSTPRINDGLAVFEVFDGGFHFHSREDKPGVIDYVTEHDIPIEYMSMVRYVPPEEVQDRVFAQLGIRKPFLGLQ
jgi:hypothetical protein